MICLGAFVGVCCVVSFMILIICYLLDLCVWMVGLHLLLLCLVVISVLGVHCLVCLSFR